jgi:ribonuclease HI
MHFPREQATNNTDEYEGLLAGLRIAIDLGIRKLIIRGDSQLVVRQVNKDYQSPLMEAYVDEVFRGKQLSMGPNGSLCNSAQGACMGQRAGFQ